ncbi:MAG: elongation factor P maturation arginine rhamnosyltransferase EarP [Hylemonella sp.]|uniref:elongation factor P maturation arginine rhamnosyltransferase EarP n=1 Tax=Hylemonella sp. TaxID=2066020 RepID=UPI00391C5AD1
MVSSRRWDIFCRVIDNYGDIGVCWRLARQLAARGQIVRLWVDDASALRWMAPQGCAGVEVRPWTLPLDLQGLPPGQVLVEAFGCELPPEFVQRYVDWRAADDQPARWINLEYLSAESYVERSHGLPSPVMQGPGRGLSKRFFYPGFTSATGGLLREPGLMTQRAGFDRDAWLVAHRIPRRPERPLVSLFCYEPAALPDVLTQLAVQNARLLVTAGRATAAVQACAVPAGLEVHYLPHLTQDDYDGLLWACDLNFVRGEDSLVRALWSGQPFVWQIYPQDDQAHHAKLDAFLRQLQAPTSLQAWHRTWNGLDAAPLAWPDLPVWRAAVLQARAGLLDQPDLLSRLLEFADSP